MLLYILLARLDLTVLQLSKVAERLFELLLSFLKLLSLVEELAESLALFDALDASE